MSAPAAALVLAAPYRDTRAADLRLSLGLAPQPALAVRALRQGPWRVELRLLGASHQVLLRDGSGAAWSETVACSAGGAALPARHAAGAYRFTSSVRHLDAPALRAAVRRLACGLAADPRALCGVYPGEDGDAMTALRLRDEDGTAVWTTWHSYPRTGEVVVTRSRLARGAA